MLVCRRTNPCSGHSNFWALSATFVGCVRKPRSSIARRSHNMEIGLVHPPVGLNLFVLSTISSAPIGEVIRGILPFLILLLIVLAIITYKPILTLWLPNAVFG